MKLYKDTYWRGLKKRDYFEGYYTRLVSENLNVAFIFGVSYAEDEHAFIQVYDGLCQEMEYFRFALDACVLREDRLYIQIGANILTDTSLIIHLHGEKLHFNVDIQFDTLRTLRDTGYKSIMGPMLNLPGLECYHGVVSMYHTWSGNINQKQQIGYSYIEKDYGQSMPSDWIWLHLTNDTGISFMLSIAKIPYLMLTPTGFLGFYSTEETTDVFASYTGAKYQIKQLDDKIIKLIIQTRNVNYEITINRKETVHLLAPVGGRMIREIEESLASCGKVTITTKKGQHIAEHEFTKVGCEVVGTAFLKEGYNGK